MKVLHICRDFVGSRVHSELYRHLEQLGIQQVVYCAYRDNSNKYKNSNYFESNTTTILYRPILKLYHRVLFFLKTRKTVADIENVVDLHEIDLIHATTVFTDGNVARALSKRHNIPYIVAARNTDYNDFIKHAPHLWLVHRDVLKNANRIIFITDRLRVKFLNHFTLKGLRDIVRAKSIIQSNGVNNYWLQNISSKKNFNHSILYVGNFEPTKNVVRLISAVVKLKNKYKDVHLDIVGGGGWQNKGVLKAINQNKDIVTFHGKIYDKNVLKEFYNKCSIFAMPSIHETFGLVYIEAMSQGMRILCSKNEGIDGVFEKRVGEFVNPLDIEEISFALERLIDSPQKYDTLSESEIKQFDWNNIAEKYIVLYNETISEKGSNQLIK